MSGAIFSREYKSHMATLRDEKIIKLLDRFAGLNLLLDAMGPNRNFIDVIYKLREKIKAKEAKILLEMVGANHESNSPPSIEGVRLLAALKFLRHFYLAGMRGGQQVWIFSAPRKYRDFPMGELLLVRAKMSQIKAKLDDVDDLFDEEIRCKIGEAVLLGLSWCEAAKFKISIANTDPGARDLVLRWFVGSGNTKFDGILAKLHDGFKKISLALNSNHIVITDMPSFRDNHDYEFTEAFHLLLADRPERPGTIYLEKAFFENYETSVLHDMKKNWARVLIHECAHIEAGAKDILYAKRGLRPGPNFPADDAIANADTWAFFAADCAGALTEGDRVRALNGTQRSRNKKPHNWN